MHSLIIFPFFDATTRNFLASTQHHPHTQKDLKKKQKTKKRERQILLIIIIIKIKKKEPKICE